MNSWILCSDETWLNMDTLEQVEVYEGRLIVTFSNAESETMEILDDGDITKIRRYLLDRQFA